MNFIWILILMIACFFAGVFRQQIWKFLVWGFKKILDLIKNLWGKYVKKDNN